MCGGNLQDVALGVKLHLVYTYLTVETVDRVGIVVAVVYDVVVVAVDEH